jgi:oligopeptide transport system ATP-binding protein
LCVAGNARGKGIDVETIVTCTNLKKYFTVKGNGIRDRKELVRAVDDVDLRIYRNETLALVGESGCGKSTLGRLIIKLLDLTEGQVMFKDQDISKLDAKRMFDLRKKMQIIFQDPYASINPRMKVLDIIGEPLETHHVARGKAKEEMVGSLIDRVGLRREALGRYPHQFSGGQRQRIGIARAIALDPEFLICDEPVSALDVSIRSQILNLLKDLQGEFDLTYLFISHDLAVVRYISDRVCVMFLGRIAELGTCKDLFEHPLHPYTKFLMSAVPLPNPKFRNRDRAILEGDIPSPINPPPGCRFNTRCPYAKELCRQVEPPMVDLGDRMHACHFPLE